MELTLRAGVSGAIPSGIYRKIPQGGIPAPILYSIFTADLTETEQTLTATYVDAILASHRNPITATDQLQYHLSRFE
jgi:hypothetical protein